ncbi:cell envelope-related transcriptional attenuator [Lachnospiraceae bacterium KM106-2]|nr:cell envelope-related transcriptional attenuator [Lachnospiraceae bacterium KM106-2]
MRKLKFKKRYIAYGLVLVIAILAGAAYFIANDTLDRINYEKAEDVKFAKTDLTDKELKEQQAKATTVPEVHLDKDVINILLIGEESIESDQGRSDSMMIATINTKQKTLKLTSLMRDIYVEIPGYRNNKLNAAFNNGGGVLLTSTIEQNFQIKLDGYVRVNFQGFEKIIDKLGGVSIDLASWEAKYLNTTNYISKKKYRNVKEGTNTLNGNQALGYCRVRYKQTLNGEKDDFGRTNRQRTVLTALFNKYKQESVLDMIDTANELMPYITTNISKTDIINYLTAAATLGTTELETFRIPVDHSYANKKLLCGSSSASVLSIDFATNQNELHKFIYGTDVDGNEATIAPSATPTVSPSATPSTNN